MLAPKPHLGACLRVMYIAIVHARRQARSGASAERTAALMDSVHNVPLLLVRWEEFDEARLRADLARYDARWTPPESPQLLVAYDEALAECSKEAR